jgi:hemolysin activation/secretion protein
MNRFKKLLLVGVIAAALPTAAYADAPAGVPQVQGEGEAAKLEKLKAGAIGAGTAAAIVEEIPRFDITRFQVEGNSILPAQLLESLLSAFTGKGKDFGDVQQAIEAMEDAYHSRGFHAVKVLLPEQELQNGAVILKVVEARIGKVVIDGNNHYDSANIRGTVPRLKEGTFPDIDRISAQIRVANESPTRKMQMLLEEGETDDKVNAVIKVADERPWKIGTYLEDTGTEATGTLRLGFLAQHANLFNKDHLLTLQYITSPDHLEKVNIYSLGYRIPFYSWGDSLDLYAGYSNVDSGKVSSDIQISGKGAFGGLRYNLNLTRLGSYEHKIIAGFDYRVFENSVLITGSQYGGDTETHTAMLGYTGGLSGTAGEAGFNINVFQNIPSSGNGSEAAFSDPNVANSRPGAVDDFTIFKGGINSVATLPADWQGRLTTNGQYTTAALISGEQFGIGGQGSVRGFGEREYPGDYGIAGSAEIYTPNIMPIADPQNGQLRALTFYDAGYVAFNKNQGEKSIASTGLGLRLSVGRYLSAGTDYAFITKAETGHSRYNGRWHFRVQLAF